VTKCNYQDTFTTCTMLANMGYLPKGVQSFEAKMLTGARACRRSGGLLVPALSVTSSRCGRLSPRRAFWAVG
jgi:hypothetical protein